MALLNPFCLLAIFLLPVCLSAQPGCDCPENFAWLTEKVRINYPGYRDKVNEQNRAAFDEYTDRHRQEAVTVASDTACFRVLYSWTRWFKDQHIQMGLNAPDEDPTAIRARFAGWETIPLDEENLKAYLDEPGRDPVEGIWQDQSGGYRIAIIRNPAPGRDFAGAILKADSVWWMPGQVKLTLRQKENGRFDVNYYMRNHEERPGQAVLREGILEVSSLGDWYRQYPGKPTRRPTPRRFRLDRIDVQTLLLTVPTMNESFRKELDSLVKANESLLRTTPNLIIDCRNNGGGSDITYRSLKPLLYTNPVRTDNMKLWATAENAEKFQNLRKNKDFPWLSRLYFGRLARKLRRHEGTFVGKKCTSLEKMKRVVPFPQKVAVLINGGCASSCEQFVLFARESDKATLIGQNTGGVLDYGNLHTLILPCGGMYLSYPTSRSCRIDEGRGIDGTGIPPDVSLDDYADDWVEFARVYLSGNTSSLRGGQPD